MDMKTPGHHDPAAEADHGSEAEFNEVFLRERPRAASNVVGK